MRRVSELQFSFSLLVPLAFDFIDNDLHASGREIELRCRLSAYLSHDFIEGHSGMLSLKDECTAVNLHKHLAFHRSHAGKGVALDDIGHHDGSSLLCHPESFGRHIGYIAEDMGKIDGNTLMIVHAYLFIESPYKVSVPFTLILEDTAVLFLHNQSVATHKFTQKESKPIKQSGQCGSLLLLYNHKSQNDRIMEGTENEVKKSKRDLLNKRLADKYPDRNFADDDAFFGQISDDYDEYDKQISGYKEREDALGKMFAADPRSASFLMAWKNGEHPMTALVRQFGKDGLEELLSNDEKMEEFSKANEDYLKRVAEEKALDDEYQKNIAETLKSMEQLQKEKGLSEEDMDKAMEFLVGIVKDGIVGKFSAESIQMALNAINHDSDVAQAADEAEVKGRNANIEEKLRKKQKGDGLGNLDGKNNGSAPTPPKRNLGALERFGGGNKTIWERGNEKRERYY